MVGHQAEMLMSSESNPSRFPRPQPGFPGCLLVGFQVGFCVGFSSLLSPASIRSGGAINNSTQMSGLQCKDSLSMSIVYHLHRHFFVDWATPIHSPAEAVERRFEINLQLLTPLCSSCLEIEVLAWSSEAGLSNNQALLGPVEVSSAPIRDNNHFRSSFGDKCQPCACSLAPSLA